MRFEKGWDKFSRELDFWLISILCPYGGDTCLFCPPPSLPPSPQVATPLRWSTRNHARTISETYFVFETEQPSLFELQGSPFNRADLNAVNANLAAMVVVLSPIVQAAAADEDQALADMEPIMASLNLKAMAFDDVATVLQKEVVSTLKGEDNSKLNIQNNRTLSISRLEEISSVLPMITELGKCKVNYQYVIVMLIN